MHDVVAAVLVDGNRVLLGHRSPSRRWYPNVWDVLGGHVGDTETPQEALRRELREELGIVISTHQGEPIAHVVDPDGQDGGIDIRIWRVTDWIGQVVNLALEEHDELRWFTEKDLSSLTLAHPALPEVLRRALADSPTRELGS